MRSENRPRLAPLLVGGAVVLLVAIVNTQVDRGQDRLPDIVLISIDTLRRDAVGLYSGESVTPRLDRWGAHAVVFERAYVPMPFTLPSHMSMFTGLYPAAHGVDRETAALSTRVGTLAEHLREAGYTTVGIHTNDWLDEKFGFGRGFDRYERLPHDLTYADRVTAAAVAAWSSGDETPRFLFVHYMDPHSDFQWGDRNRLPYYSPPRLRSQESVPDFCDEADRCATEFLLAADEGRRPLSAEELRALRRLYLSGIAYLDEQLGILLDWLAEAEADRDVLVIVTSDHGEEFREHGRLLHSQLYDETSAVPLLVRWRARGWSGGRVSALVEAVDVYPTILAAAATGSRHPVQGLDLLVHSPHGAGEAVREDTRYGLGQDKLDRSVVALFGRDDKLLLNLETGAVELYELRGDPGERVNLAAQAPERVARMRRSLLDLLDASRGLRAMFGTEEPARSLSERERRALRALGYLR